MRKITLLFLFLHMLTFRTALLLIIIASCFLTSCKDDRNDFNPKKLANDEVIPPIFNRVSKIEFLEHADFVLQHKNIVSFEEDSITKNLWSRIYVSNKSNDILIYEPEYTFGRLSKLIDRTSSDQDIEIEYIYNQVMQKHLIAKIKYYKYPKPYSISFNYVNSKLIKIALFEIETNTRFERPFPLESIDVCQYVDSCQNEELKYQFTSNENAYYLSNEMLPVFLCFSDNSTNNSGKLLNLARYLPLYIYEKLPYSYQNSKYSYKIDFVKDDLSEVSYQILKQNSINLYDYSIHIDYRY